MLIGSSKVQIPVFLSSLIFTSLKVFLPSSEYERAFMPFPSETVPLRLILPETRVPSARFVTSVTGSLRSRFQVTFAFFEGFAAEESPFISIP